MHRNCRRCTRPVLREASARWDGPFCMCSWSTLLTALGLGPTTTWSPSASSVAISAQTLTGFKRWIWRHCYPWYCWQVSLILQPALVLSPCACLETYKIYIWYHVLFTVNQTHPPCGVSQHLHLRSTGTANILCAHAIAEYRGRRPCCWCRLLNFCRGQYDNAQVPLRSLEMF